MRPFEVILTALALAVVIGGILGAFRVAAVALVTGVIAIGFAGGYVFGHVTLWASVCFFFAIACVLQISYLASVAWRTHQTTAHTDGTHDVEPSSRGKRRFLWQIWRNRTL